MCNVVDFIRIHEKGFNMSKNIKTSGLVSLKQAACLLGVSKSTIYKRIRKGEINAYQFGSTGKYLLDTNELAKALRKVEK